MKYIMKNKNKKKNKKINNKLKSNETKELDEILMWKALVYYKI